MPSHKIHVAIAQEINKELGLNSDEISLGSVLPDLVNTHSHSAPHFQTRMVYPDNLANPDQFVKEYGVKDAISMGYLLHLITDKFYNQKYLEKFFVFEDGKPSKPLIDIDPQERHYVKNHDFNEYDRYLINLGNIKPFSGLDVISKVHNYGEDIGFDKEYLKKYIEKFNSEVSEKNLDFNFIAFTKEELDNMFFECIEYIKNYFKENKFTK